HYVVADGRYLAFSVGPFDRVFSYRVLEHLCQEDVRLTLLEICQVLRSSGECQVQMPNAYGIRCLYHQARRGFRETRDFEVRYWTTRELLSTFGTAVGPARISVDGYFSLNAQSS